MFTPTARCCRPTTTRPLNNTIILSATTAAHGVSSPRLLLLIVIFQPAWVDPLENKVLPVPSEIDYKIARMKLNAMKIGIDTLTEGQEEYLSSRQEGT